MLYEASPVNTLSSGGGASFLCHISLKLAVVMVVAVKVVVPLDSLEGLESRVAEHFGRAPYFALVELRGEEARVEFFENPRRWGRTPGAFVAEMRVDCVAVKGGIGVRALTLLRESRVRVLEVEGDRLGEVIEALKSGKYREYAGEGCPGRREF